MLGIELSLSRCPFTDTFVPLSLSLPSSDSYADVLISRFSSARTHTLTLSPFEVLAKDTRTFVFSGGFHCTNHTLINHKIDTTVVVVARVCQKYNTQPSSVVVVDFVINQPIIGQNTQRVHDLRSSDMPIIDCETGHPGLLFCLHFGFVGLGYKLKGVEIAVANCPPQRKRDKVSKGSKLNLSPIWVTTADSWGKNLFFSRTCHKVGDEPACHFRLFLNYTRCT